jgi:hypothetical protein
MGTVLCHNGWSTNRSRGSRMVAQALSMRKESDMSDMTLFPYYPDILCISAPGTPQPIKNRSLPSALLWCKWKVDCSSLWHKTHDRNGLPRSHLHHNSRRQVDHTYCIMPNQQCNQLHICIYIVDNFLLTLVQLDELFLSFGTSSSACNYKHYNATLQNNYTEIKRTITSHEENTM